MTRMMKFALVLLTLALGGGAGPGGGGCDCNCDWGDETPSGNTGWVEPETAPQITAPQPEPPQDAVSGPVERVVDPNLPTPAPRVIKEQTIARGRWPEWYVRRTPGATLNATWDCNGWRRGTNPVIQPGTVVKICGW